jgi:hypothetical protein
VGIWILAVVGRVGVSGCSLFWVACWGCLRAENTVGAKYWDK